MGRKNKRIRSIRSINTPNSIRNSIIIVNTPCALRTTSRVGYGWVRVKRANSRKSACEDYCTCMICPPPRQPSVILPCRGLGQRGSQRPLHHYMQSAYCVGRRAPNVWHEFLINIISFVHRSKQKYSGAMPTAKQPQNGGFWLQIFTLPGSRAQTSITCNAQGGNGGLAARVRHSASYGVDSHLRSNPPINHQSIYSPSQSW